MAGGQPTFGHGKVCYLVLPARDPERAAAFYRDVFGWRIRTGGDGSLAFDDGVGEVSGTWVASDRAASDDGIDVHLMVDDLVEAVARIRAAGGAVDEDGLHLAGERWGHFRDPEGNRLGIYEHRGG